MGVMTASTSRRLLFALATSTSFERALTGTRPGSEAAWRLARRYVAGTTLRDAFAVAERLARAGMSASVDLFGEHTSDLAHADRVAEEYVALAGRLGDAPRGTWLSLDLSHLALATDPRGTLTRLDRITAAMPDATRLQIGAEEAALTEAVLQTVLNATDRSRLTATVQANLRRSPRDVERLVAAGVPIRLVKGAYLEPPAVAWLYGEPTDLAYLALAEQLADAGADASIATHDGLLREACRNLLPGATIEMLLGVRPDVALSLAGDPATAVRIYVPYGPGWFRYAMRRLAESRGA